MPCILVEKPGSQIAPLSPPKVVLPDGDEGATERFGTKQKVSYTNRPFAFTSIDFIPKVQG